MMPKVKPDTEAKKPSIQISRNRTSGKKKVDLFANLRRNTEHPLDDLLPETKPTDNNASEIQLGHTAPIGNIGTTGITNTTGISGITSSTSTTGTTGYTKKNEKQKFEDQRQHSPIAPVRDFTKTPNSLTRVILAQGLFRGKSKQIYDYFWSVSRGAINPARQFRRTHKEIQKGSGIGSRNTVIDGLKHLEIIGLIKKTSAVGEAGGNEYEIFTPDEIGYTGITDTTGITGITESSRNLVIPVIPESGYTGITQSTENKDTYTASKTSLKTNTKNDDETRLSETFFAMAKRLDEAAQKLTGRGVSPSEMRKWETLGELLILELETAASRTDSISSVPAFLTEVLRRKLLGGNSPIAHKASGTKPDTVGKPNEAGEYEKKPLDAAGREAALIELQDFAGEEFLQDFEKWYTAEDWSWLMAELDKTKQSHL